VDGDEPVNSPPRSAEFTVEANPRDLDRAGYARLVELGATRLSLGVQSFDDAVLVEMGRHHNAADSRRAAQPVKKQGELPTIPVDEHAAEVRAIKAG
jgi:coproporphyrinogen III oxidase-like Fe-S oxidoreductase